MPNAPQPLQIPGDGTRLEVPKARFGVRRGPYRVLMISTVLTALPTGVVWLGFAHSPGSQPRVSAPTGQPHQQGGL